MNIKIYKKICLIKKKKRNRAQIKVFDIKIVIRLVITFDLSL